MTRRGAALCCTSALALLCALSTGSRVYYLAALCFALALFFGLVCRVWLGASLRMQCNLSAKQVMRGEEAWLRTTLRHTCLLPMSDAVISVQCGDEMRTAQVKVQPFKEDSASIALPCTHVGTYACRVVDVRFQDLFGLFTARKKGGEADMLLVLPKPFDIEKPTFALGDMGNAVLSRTQDDYTSPEDVRTYIPGDAMKRIHWKLSSRKRELLVRRYETPAPPDTLILVDPNRPEGGKGEKMLSLRDAICETAVAVASLQLMDEIQISYLKRM